MPNNDKIKEIYEAYGKEAFRDENEFRSYVSTPKGASDFFDAFIKEDGAFVDVKEFSGYLGKPLAAPRSGGGGGLSSPKAPGMDGGRSQFGIQNIGQTAAEAMSQPKPKQQKLPAPTEKKPALQETPMFMRQALEYYEENLRENQGRYNEKSLAIGARIAEKYGRGGPGAIEYAKLLRDAAVNKSAADRLQINLDKIRKPVLGDNGAPSINQFEETQRSQKVISENLDKDFIKENGQYPLFSPVDINKKKEEYKKDRMRYFDSDVKANMENIEPVVKNLSNQIIDQYNKSGRKAFTLKTNIGVKIDPEAIDNWVEDRSIEYGFEDNDYFKTYLRDRLKSELESVPVIERASEIVKGMPTFKSLQGAEGAINSSAETIKRQTEILAGDINKDIERQFNEQSQPLKQQYTSNVSQLDNSYLDTKRQVEYEMTNLNNMARNGSIDQATYSKYVANIEAKNKQAYDQYLSARNNLNSSLLDELNRMSIKYNAQGRRRINELNKASELKYNEIQAKYENISKDPSVSAKLKSEWDQAVKQAYNESEKKDIERSYALDISTRALDRIASSIGTAVSSIGTSLGSDRMVIAGDLLAAQTYMPPIDYKKYSDGLFNYLVESTSQLAGSMSTSMAASAIGAAAVAGSGGTLLPAVGAMLSGWVTESAQIAGSVKRDIFSQTGSALKADNAAKKSWQTQLYTLPLYAFEGAPFIKGFLKGGGAFTRIAKGAALEYVTEFSQEYSQNIFDEAIRKGENPYKAFGVEMDAVLEGLKELKLTPTMERVGVEIGPVALFGAGGQVSSVVSEKRKEIAVKKYASKLTPADFAPDASAQFVFRAVANKGKDFAGAVVTSLYTSGQIGKPEMEAMMTQVESSDKLLKTARESGIVNDKQKISVIYAYNQKSEYLKARSESLEADNPLKAALLDLSKNYSKIASDMALTGKAPVITATMSNGDYIYVTLEEMESRLQDDEFVDELAKGGISLDIGDNLELGNAISGLLTDAFAKRDQRIKQGTEVVEAESAAAPSAAPSAAPAPPTSEQGAAAPEALATAQDFEVFDMRGKSARIQREKIREKLGEAGYQRMEQITREFETIITDLETRGKIRKECP